MGGELMAEHRTSPSDMARCDNCGNTWTEEELDPIHDYWGRVDPGGVVPLGQCPNVDCRALCYPSYGYVYDLEQRHTTLRDILTRFLQWEQAMGGWEAPVWDEARRALGMGGDDLDDEDTPEG